MYNKQKIMVIALYTYLLIMIGLSVAWPQHQAAFTLVILSIALVDILAIKYVDKSKLSWKKKPVQSVEEDSDEEEIDNIDDEY